MSGNAITHGYGSLDLDRLGRLWLAWSARGLVLLDQKDRRFSREALARWLPELGADDAPSEMPARFADALRAYDRGEPIDPARIPVDLRGTGFQNRVWVALRRVERGRVRTYAGLAADVGAPRAMRAVGTAMAKNPLPIVVPCHRVIANGSKLGGYSDGLPRKRVLLHLEGVAIEGDRVLGGQLDLL
jgi:O-6-methylguanine DNA methyltransferase